MGKSRHSFFLALFFFVVFVVTIKCLEEAKKTDIPTLLKVLTTDWAVEINIPVDASRYESYKIAKRVAEEHGLVLVGRVGELSHFYVLRSPEHLSNREVEEHIRNTSANMEKNGDILWYERQKIRKHGKRIFRQEFFHDIENKVSADSRIENYQLKSTFSRLSKLVSRDYSPPTDPLFGDQWHLKNVGQVSQPDYPGLKIDLNTEPAWKEGYTGKGVNVAIVDDGVEFSHPDLSSGYRADLSHNWNDGDENNAGPNVKNGDFHGTACAGCASARSDGKYCGENFFYMQKILTL